MKQVDGKLTFTPDVENGCYTFEGKATLGNLIDGLVPNAGETLPKVIIYLTDQHGSATIGS